MASTTGWVYKDHPKHYAFNVIWVFTTSCSCREAFTLLKAWGHWVLMGSFGTPGKTLTITPYAKSAWWSDLTLSEHVCHHDPPWPWQQRGEKSNPGSNVCRAISPGMFLLTELIMKELNATLVNKEGPLFCYLWTTLPKDLALYPQNCFSAAYFCKHKLYTLEFCNVPGHFSLSQCGVNSSLFSTSILYFSLIL